MEHNTTQKYMSTMLIERYDSILQVKMGKFGTGEYDNQHKSIHPKYSLFPSILGNNDSEQGRLLWRIHFQCKIHISPHLKEKQFKYLTK